MDFQDTINSDSYKNWIHQQEEPGAPILHFKFKRDNQLPTWVEKNNAIDRIIAEVGIENYRRMVQEDADRARQYYEYENNL